MNIMRFRCNINDKAWSHYVAKGSWVLLQRRLHQHIDDIFSLKRTHNSVNTFVGVCSSEVIIENFKHGLWLISKGKTSKKPLTCDTQSWPGSSEFLFERVLTSMSRVTKGYYGVQYCIYPLTRVYSTKSSFNCQKCGQGWNCFILMRCGIATSNWAACWEPIEVISLYKGLWPMKLY